LNPPLHHVVIVGAGFGGLEAAHRLADAGVQITIIDRRNHHLFQPLLYQVATASLAPSEIAWPIRHLLRKQKDIATLLAPVAGIDKSRRTVLLGGGGEIAYDTLVLATGARHAYFGHDEWASYAPGLKTLEDATNIRASILLAFEMAERELDPQRRAAFLNFVIVGAGPTGVELAGTIAELAHHHLRSDFRNFDPRAARVILIEAGPRVLPTFADSLSAYAQRALEKLGVEVQLGHPVRECDTDGVVFNGARLMTKTIIWAAGVQASSAGKWLNAEVDHARRIKVESDLSVAGNPEIFVIGDTATIDAWHGEPVPGIAPAAKQQGRHVARTIRARLRGDTHPHPFRYKHAGSLATIGRRAAVIDFGWIKLTGWLAWWVWGVAHIYFLIGLRNRLAVAMNWLWIYATGNRSARLITQRGAM
jgi:NADH dehydrogenase